MLIRSEMVYVGNCLKSGFRISIFLQCLFFPTNWQTRHRTMTPNEVGTPETPMDSEKENFPFPKKPISLTGRCTCNWADCQKMQREFTRRVNDSISEWQGGNCFILDLSRESEKDTVYHNAVLSNISCIKSNLCLERVWVAWHHWSIEQLQHMQWNKLRPSTPIPVRVLSETQFSSDKQDFIRVGDKKTKEALLSCT